MYDRNTTAFFGMIAKSEGTYGLGDDGYNVLVGSTPKMPLLFHSYADHPRVRITARRDDPRTPQNEEIISTAAGRYQILARYFDVYRERMRLRDFGPASQDAIAARMIRECHATDDVMAGRVAEAVAKCSSRWASLPGAGYGQHENRIAQCEKWFVECGGVLEEDEQV